MTFMITTLFLLIPQLFLFSSCDFFLPDTRAHHLISRLACTITNGSTNGVTFTGQINYILTGLPTETITGLHIHWAALPSVPSGKYIFNVSTGTASGFTSVTNQAMPVGLIAMVAAIRNNDPNVPIDPLYINIHTNVNTDGGIAGRLTIGSSSASLVVSSFILLSLALSAIMF